MSRPLEPEWEGHVTLEFSNTTTLPAKIYANEGVAQMLFFESDEVCEVSYKRSWGEVPGADRGDSAQSLIFGPVAGCALLNEFTDSGELVMSAVAVGGKSSSGEPDAYAGRGGSHSSGTAGYAQFKQLLLNCGVLDAARSSCTILVQ